MDKRIRDLLKPEILNSIQGLELIARIVVEGFMSGGNRSNITGVGQEFSQYRNYEPGDDLRQLDWKMYARSERYFIKQSDIETNITVKFVIDASGSMGYEEKGWSKIQFTKVMTAALAYLARKQGDAIGLYVISGESVTAIQARYEHRQYMRFLHALVDAKAEQAWKKDEFPEQLFDHHHKEMIIFISDLYEEEDHLRNFITRLKTTRNEVVVFHLLGEHERDLDFGGSFTFEDMETGATVKIDTAAQQKIYKERMAEWIGKWRSWILEKDISYYLSSMTEPLEDTLRHFLRSRKRVV
jgi:uncharacterized protein (DUF58 family)